MSKKLNLIIGDDDGTIGYDLRKCLSDNNIETSLQLEELFDETMVAYIMDQLDGESDIPYGSFMDVMSEFSMWYDSSCSSWKKPKVDKVKEETPLKLEVGKRDTTLVRSLKITLTEKGILTEEALHKVCDGKYGTLPRSIATTLNGGYNSITWVDYTSMLDAIGLDYSVTVTDKVK